MKRYIRYPVIMAGAALMGFAVKNIYDPAGIVTGGFAGIAIIAAGLKAVPLWVTNMALNVPLFIMAWRMLGQKIIVRSLIAVVIYSASMAVSPEVTWFAEDIFISAAVGGLTTGLGMGLVLYAGGTSGGVDMLAALICHFTHKVRLQWVIFAADFCICCELCIRQDNRRSGVIPRSSDNKRAQHRNCRTDNEHNRPRRNRNRWDRDVYRP